jgi:N-acyl-L-homoserine lactone synthetase
MIQLIEATARPLEHDMLRSMFAARKRVFVDLLGWDVPVLAGRYEVDQFDHEEARYLVVSDEAGRHLASARLLPTTRAHLLGSLFPQLCDGEAPTGADVFEITRFCLDRSLDARTRRQARDALVIGLVDHARASGIRTYSAVAGTTWFQKILAFGWRCRPLGIPTVTNGETLVALEISIMGDTRARLVAAGIGGVAAPMAVAA